MATIPPQIVISDSQLGVIISALQNIADSLQNQYFWNTQLFAAVIGAAIGLIPYFYLLNKDRSIIKVKFGHALMSYSGGQVRSALWIKISNSGRRPITVSSVFLEFADGETLIFLNDSLFIGGSGLPKPLGEGEAHSVTIAAGDLAPEILKKQHYPTKACYRDALGKVYKTRISHKFWDNFFKVSSSELGKSAQ